MMDVISVCACVCVCVCLPYVCGSTGGAEKLGDLLAKSGTWRLGAAFSIQVVHQTPDP